SSTGIKTGDVLVVASDLTRMAFNARKLKIRFDAGCLIDAFLDTLGPEGTLLIPAYNFNLRNGDTYSSRETPPGTGALALAAFRRNDFLRTFNPFHSFLVKGKYAENFTALRNRSSFGMDSPFALMKELDARMLFIGTSLADALTYTHFVEESEKVHYRKYSRINISLEGIQKESFLFYKKKTGWTMDMSGLETLLEPMICKDYKLNGIRYILLNLRDAHEIIKKDIRENRARNIARFDFSIFLKEIGKEILYKLRKYRTVNDRIKFGTGKNGNR
ncbi:MAG: AAC(3) family N-acetyltransferase, partial [Bacteroidetes bacterium]|nr:AAC(3) family N-acetyltransferase [Bacteroidota bacterium]